jgi:DNA-binding NarL/FixJ family response regulator
MRLLCVARHGVLGDHLAALFRGFGAETRSAVGLAEALAAAQSFAPEAVICDYDLLVTVSLTAWERDPQLSRVPIVAVSLTRRPEEVHALDVNNVAGFVYLPSLEPEDGVRLLAALAGRGASSGSMRPRRDTPESVSAC